MLLANIIIQTTNNPSTQEPLQLFDHEKIWKHSINEQVLKAYISAIHFGAARTVSVFNIMAGFLKIETNHFFWLLS